VKKRYLIKRIFFPFLLTGLLMFGNVALADYVNPPDWSSNPYYTHQSWDFNETGRNEKGKPLPPKEQFLPDGKPPMINPYGKPGYTFYAASKKHADWSYMPMGMKNWTRHGMWAAIPPGVPAGLIFDIPNPKTTNLKTELWLQYVISEYKGTEFKTTVYTPEDKVFTMISRDKKGIKSGGGSGRWYRVTEIWQISHAPPVAHVKIEFDKNIGLIEQVSIDTRCVPISITAAQAASRYQPN
jgi:hypothetical protein